MRWRDSQHTGSMVYCVDVFERCSTRVALFNCAGALRQLRVLCSPSNVTFLRIKHRVPSGGGDASKIPKLRAIRLRFGVGYKAEREETNCAHVARHDDEEMMKKVGKHFFFFGFLNSFLRDFSTVCFGERLYAVHGITSNATIIWYKYL